MRLTAFIPLAPIFALAAQPHELGARQEGVITVPEGPLPLCTSHCFGRWGWPITLCTGQEGLNHLIKCFYEECEDESRRIHAQLAAEQNCEEGMGWPDRMPEDLKVKSLPAAAVDGSTPSTPASLSANSPASATSSQGSTPTGAFAVENSSSTVPDATASSTETPNAAHETAVVQYAGVAAAIIGICAVL